MPEPSRTDESPPTQPPVKPVHETASSAEQHTAGLPSSGGATGALDFLAKAEAADELGRLAHYRVLKELGRGGMGCVLLAEDMRLQRQVALKVMLPQFAQDARAKERFLREARSAAKIKHDNVITIHQVDEANGVPFIALEFLEGAPLDKYLKDKGALPLPIAVRIAREMAEGLSAAHTRGLTHRDIKPGNVWLEAPKGRVKILDFGLARADKEDTHLTQSGAIVGTPAFMAPEQARGEKVDGRCDLFSLGVVLYRMTTGKQPFIGPTTIAVLTAIAIDTPAPPRSVNAKIPESLEKVILKLLEKDPGQRYATAKELIADLTGVLKGLAQANQLEPPTEAYVPADASSREEATLVKVPVTVPGGRGSKRWPKMLVAAGLGFLALAIVAWQVVIRIQHKDGSETKVEVKDVKSVVVEKDGHKIGAVPIQAKKGVAPAYAVIPFGPAFAKKHQEDWAAYAQVPVESRNKVSITMVVIPPDGKAATKAYLLSKYEVTQQQYQQVMGRNPSYFQPKQENIKLAGIKDTSNFPVDSVRWYEAIIFCNKLSELERLKPYYALEVQKREGDEIVEADVKILGGHGYHIPTDAEWEQGCRAGTKGKYHFGDSDENLLEYAWFDKNGEGRTHAVGEKKPNAFGLYDMHGNVREWNEEMLTNATTGAPEGVLRGGSWNLAANTCAVSTRFRNGPAYRHNRIGLRLARVPSSEATVAVNPPPFAPLTFDEKEAKKQQADWAAKLKLPVEATTKSGMKLVLIPPAGVALPKAYYLGKYEVTQGEWEQVMAYNPSGFGPKNPKIAGMDTSQFPVEQVSWYDSVEFCNKLSEREGLKPYYELTVTKRGGKDGKQIDEAGVKILGGAGYHIPTDAEWEHGCRAGTKTKYHCGDKDEDLLDYAWFKDNSDGRTHVVGEKKPNAFGLYDMHGNVREWNEEMLKNATTGAPERGARGGSWGSPAGNCAVSPRTRLGPASRHLNAGLRLARVP